MIFHSDILESVICISHKAGAAILEVYETDFSVQNKSDDSPLTKADMASHHIIVEALGKLTPDIPVLSEESTDLLEKKEWRNWDSYWLIDPLDGTKEFVKRNGEFTVNIALIEKHKPVFGVVYVPVSKTTYIGAQGLGAFKLNDGNTKLDTDNQIFVQKNPELPYRIVASRSHPSTELQGFLSGLEEHEIVSMGSSLKFCLIAEGAADCYPRFGPTSEWDTAAAQAVVEAAGGAVDNLDGSPLLYNTKAEILNPYFMVHSNCDINWFEFIPDSIERL